MKRKHILNNTSAVIIFILLVFMLLIYFNVYSGLPLGFYISFAIFFLVILILSLLNFEASVLVFIFFIPLTGFLGPLFKTQDAYIILIMATALIVGYLIRSIKFKFPLLDIYKRYNIAIVIMLAILTLSFILVLWRVYLYDFKMYGLLKQYIGTDFFKTIKSTSILYSIFFTGLLFQVITLETKFSNKFIDKVFITIFISFFIVFAVGVYQKYLNPDFGVVAHTVYKGDYQINSTLRMANSLGEYLIFIIPISIGFLGYYLKKSKIKSIFSLITLIQALILLYFNGNRTGLIGVALALFFYGIYFLWRWLRFIKNIKIRRVIIIFLIIVIIPSLIISSFILIKNIDPDKTDSMMIKRLKRNIDQMNFDPLNYNDSITKLTSGRSNLWPLAIQMVKDHPLSGVGIGQYEHHQLEYNMKVFGKFVQADAFALNQYLHVSAELGIFYLLAFLWFLLDIIIIAFRKIKLVNNFKFLYIGILVSLITSLIAFNFNAGTGFIEAQYMLSLVIGLLANKFIFKLNENK